MSGKPPKSRLSQCVAAILRYARYLWDDEISSPYPNDSVLTRTFFAGVEAGQDDSAAGKQVTRDPPAFSPERRKAWLKGYKEGQYDMWV